MGDGAFDQFQYHLYYEYVRNVVIGLWVMALLISSSIICTTNMSPKIRIVGDGAFDQFQYHLYYEYVTEDPGDSGARSIWLSDRIWNCYVCIFETHFFKKIEHIFRIRKGGSADE